MAYFKGLGFPEEMIWRGVDVVDNDHFSRLCSCAEVVETAGIGWKLPEKFFLTVARHSEEKNLLYLLKAFSSYRQKGGKWDIVLVGAGPLETELRTFAQNEIPEGAHFISWKQYEEIPAYYGKASAFILPSVSEPWGLGGQRGLGLRIARAGQQTVRMSTRALPTGSQRLRLRSVES